MNKNLKEFLKFASFPIGLIIALSLFLVIYMQFDLPTFTEIVAYAEIAFERYGYPVIFIAAVAEAFLLLNWYLPGSVVIVLGMVMAIEGDQNVLITALVVLFGLFIGYTIDYILGRYGWYKLLLKFGLKDEIEKTKKKVEDKGGKIFLMTFIHPHLGALTATAAGILQMKFKTFVALSLLALTMWGTIWSCAAFIAGPQILELVNFQSLFILVALWLLVMFVQFTYSKLKKPAPTPAPEFEEIDS